MDIPLLKAIHRETLDLAAVVVVDTPTELALERLVTQRGMDPGDARARIAAQPDRADPPGGGRPGDRQLGRRRPPRRRGRPGLGELLALRERLPTGRRPGGRPRPPIDPGGAVAVPAAEPHRAAGTIDDVPAFEVVSPFRPAGDQPQAIAGLVEGLERGDRYQTLLGITGSGKTATIAWTIEAVQRPTLIIEPNKSLAAQLAAELKEFFPRNRVEYFVSYYDYYQPEAYVPSSDTYIEKDSSINDEIDRLRHASHLVAPAAAGHHRGGLGLLHLRPGLARRVPRPDRGPAARARTTSSGPCSGGWSSCSTRATTSPSPGASSGSAATPSRSTPPTSSQAVRVEFFGDTVERIRPFDVLTGEIGDDLEELVVFANTHYGTGDERMRRAVDRHRGRAAGAAGRARAGRGKLLEAQRLRMRTEYDLEMLAETGVCSGRRELQPAPRRPGPGGGALHPARLLPQGLPGRPRREPRGRAPAPRPVRRGPVPQGDPGRPRVPPALGPGQPPPALRGVHRADRPGHPAVGHPGPVGARAQHQRGRAGHPAHRPGRPRGGHRAHHRPDRRPAGADRRAPWPTATGCWSPPSPRRWPRTSPTTWPSRASGSSTSTPTSTPWPGSRSCASCASGVFDVLVGINLLREGLDLPEVALVAILDADKEGFLRSASSLIQTMGRAARNVNGRVVMYADTDHRLDDRGHRGDPAPPGPPDRLQRGPRHRPADHHQVGHRHPRAGPGRRSRRRSLAGLTSGADGARRRTGRQGARRRRPAGGGRRDGPGPRARTPTSCPA